MGLSPELLSFILGGLVTMVTSLVQNPGWNREVKTAICIGASVVAAVLSLSVTGSLHLDGRIVADLGKNVPLIYGSATAFYNLKFKKTLTNKKLQGKKVL